MFLLRNSQCQQKLVNSVKVINKINSTSNGSTLFTIWQLNNRIGANRWINISSSPKECPQVALDTTDIIAGVPPKNARVVICGGGIMGAAVAYHLALAGWGPHTVLIDQGRYLSIV